MKKYKKRKLLGALIFVAVFAAAIAVVMLLWNALLPELFELSSINYWQAGGLMILSRLLLGGFGRFKKRGHFFGHGHHGHHRHGGHHHWHEMREKMRGMSREERHQFIREHMEKHHEEHHGECCDDGSEHEDNHKHGHKHGRGHCHCHSKDEHSPKDERD